MSKFDPSLYRAGGSAADGTIRGALVNFSMLDPNTNQYQQIGKLPIIAMRKNRQIAIYVLNQQQKPITYVQSTPSINWIIQNKVYCTFLDANNRRCLALFSSAEEARIFTLIAFSSRVYSSQSSFCVDAGNEPAQFDEEEDAIVNLTLYDLSADKLERPLSVANETIIQQFDCGSFASLFQNSKIGSFYVGYVSPYVFALAELTGKTPHADDNNGDENENAEEENKNEEENNNENEEGEGEKKSDENSKSNPFDFNSDSDEDNKENAEVRVEEDRHKEVVEIKQDEEIKNEKSGEEKNEEEEKLEEISQKEKPEEKHEEEKQEEEKQEEEKQEEEKQEEEKHEEEKQEEEKQEEEKHEEEKQEEEKHEEEKHEEEKQEEEKQEEEKHEEEKQEEEKHEEEKHEEEKHEEEKHEEEKQEEEKQEEEKHEEEKQEEEKQKEEKQEEEKHEEEKQEEEKQEEEKQEEEKHEEEKQEEEKHEEEKQEEEKQKEEKQEEEKHEEEKQEEEKHEEEKHEEEKQEEEKHEEEKQEEEKQEEEKHEEEKHDQLLEDKEHQEERAEGNGEVPIEVNHDIPEEPGDEKPALKRKRNLFDDEGEKNEDTIEKEKPIEEKKEGMKPMPKKKRNLFDDDEGNQTQEAQLQANEAVAEAETSVLTEEFEPEKKEIQADAKPAVTKGKKKTPAKKPAAASKKKKPVPAKKKKDLFDDDSTLEDPKPKKAPAKGKTSTSATGTKKKATKKKSILDDMLDAPAKGKVKGKKSLFGDNETDDFGLNGKAKGKGKGKKKSLFGNDDDLFNFDDDDDGGASLDILGTVGKKVKRSKKSASSTANLHSAANKASNLTQREEYEAQLAREAEKMPAKNDPGRFGYVDRRTRFGNSEDMLAAARQRFEKYEKLIRSIELDDLNRPMMSLPDIVLRESIANIVRQNIAKDKELAQKEMLIEALNIETTSTYETEEIHKQMRFKQSEIDAEKKRTEEQEKILQEIQKKIDALHQEIEKEREDCAKKEEEIKQKHSEDMYNEAMAIISLQEPFEESMRKNKSEKLQILGQLMPMTEENNTMKAGINMDDFNEVVRIREAAPGILKNAVIRLRDAADDIFENQFNPLKDYNGTQIANAVRNILQKEAKKVLPK